LQVSVLPILIVNKDEVLSACMMLKTESKPVAVLFLGFAVAEYPR
jgi:hypothetical protein